MNPMIQQGLLQQQRAMREQFQRQLAQRRQMMAAAWLANQKEQQNKQRRSLWELFRRRSH